MSTEYRRECEEGLAIAAMTNSALAVELSTVTSEADFSDGFLGQIFRLAGELELAEQFSQHRLRSELRSLGFMETTTELASLIKLSQETVLDHTARYYASQLANLAMVDEVAREIKTSLSKLVADSNTDARAIASSLIAKLESVSARDTSLWEQASDVAEKCYASHRKQVLEEDDAPRSGIPTGYPSIDFITGGFFKGQLWQIAARSYMGKSAVAINFAAQQISRGNGVYFASYEMENEELMDRMFADRTGVPLSNFTQQRMGREELARVLQASSEFHGSHYCLDDRPPETLPALKARIKLAAARRPISLVIIDHLLMFPADARIPRHEQLVELTRGMKQLAKECDTTVMLLNQLNVEAEGVEPNNRHFAQSKGILANLDVSILLHRESNSSEEMLFKITKNRKGAPGEIRMSFYGEVQRLEDNIPVGEQWEPV